MRKLQIGVMGSAADLKYAKEVEELAEEVGMRVAQNNAILLFGAEKDYDSLSTAACKGAKRFDGTTVGVTYEKGKDIYMPENADIIICSGMVRGGGRELVLSLSCDSMISISGGSGTLTELAIAYQGNIPTVALVGSGGWSDMLANQYFDGRKRRLVYGAGDPEEAVNMAIKLGRDYLQSFKSPGDKRYL
jgi:uncharacterized protein (TIGR00725 family)